MGIGNTQKLERGSTISGGEGVNKLEKEWNEIGKTRMEFIELKKKIREARE